MPTRARTVQSLILFIFMTLIFYKMVTDTTDSPMVTTIEYREDTREYTSIFVPQPENPWGIYTMQECKCGKATVFRNISQLANVDFTILLLLRKCILNGVKYFANFTV